MRLDAPELLQLTLEGSPTVASWFTEQMIAAAPTITAQLGFGSNSGTVEEEADGNQRNGNPFGVSDELLAAATAVGLDFESALPTPKARQVLHSPRLETLRLGGVTARMLTLTAMQLKSFSLVASPKVAEVQIAAPVLVCLEVDLPLCSRSFFSLTSYDLRKQSLGWGVRQRYGKD